MKTIKFNGVISSISSRQDRSLRMSVSTPELSTTERATFMEFQGVNADFTMEPLDEEVLSEDVVVDAAEGTKTPSKRLRSVLFLLWKQRGEKEPFDTFYYNSMEKFINRIKEELE